MSEAPKFPSKPSPNPSDGPFPASRGPRLPEIDPNDSADVVAHKQAVRTRMQLEAVEQQAQAVRLAAAHERLGDGGLLASLDADAAKLLEERIIGACHGSTRAYQEVLRILREMGFPR